MRLTVVGIGYVGLVAGACFSEMGNKVTCVDVNEEKIDQLQKGNIPIYEPGINELVVNNLKSKNLSFTNDLPVAIRDAEIIFIAVGTPIDLNGSADLKYVLSVSKEIGENLNNKCLIVNKSTVPVGTASRVKQIINSELKNRKLKFKCDVASNPEFLKEGSAVNDFMKPDRIIIGVESDSSLELLKRLYASFTMSRDRIISMEVRSAEMTKYAANAMLATKISFMNEIANICEQVGADVNDVRIGIGSDKRIGYSYIYPGIGYGGSCFPKDIRALSNLAAANGYDTHLLNSVEKVNNRQRTILTRKVIKRFGEDLSNLTFGVWGLAFKPGTDDIREAPSIYLIKELLSRGAKVKVYDPKALDNAKQEFYELRNEIQFCDTKIEAAFQVDALLLVTEWKEFRTLDFNMLKNKLKKPIIFDGRNQYDSLNLKGYGFEYYQIGKV